MDNELFPEELARIRWRSALLAAPGGSAWLVHVGRLFEFNEKLLGPRHIGLPQELRVALFRAEREKSNGA